MNDDARRGLGDGRPSVEDARLERLLADGLAASAPSRAPDRLRPEIKRTLRQVRPRPRWLAILKEPPMRHASRVVVGSPTARVAAIGAATLLVTLLATAALVAGAQSPSPAPPDEGVAPQPPTEFTGTWCIGPEVASDRRGTQEPAVAIGDEGMLLGRNRRGAWRNPITMSDPRLQGDGYQTYEKDTYTMPGAATRLSVIASTLSIVNEEGAWVSALYRATFADGAETPYTMVFIGEGAYEGLIAIMEDTADEDTADDSQGGFCNEVRGIIFDGAPVPEPYKPE